MDSMTSITIRNVPDNVRNELAARARLSGRSLQEYLRSELTELARRPDPDVLLAQVRERTRRTGSHLSASQILAHRDRDRR
jgi:plasmid stability protein